MKIGYYAHHHGSGHCRQADKLAKLLTTKPAPNQATAVNPSTSCHVLTVFTSMTPSDYTFHDIAAADIVRLPDEHERANDMLPGRAGQYWQPRCLHYSPVGSQAIQQRSHLILSEVQTRHLELMIIDLSVEVALLCRTASIPYLYMRLPGERNDLPHISAFEGAIGLLAMYPKLLESASTPDWVRQKTLYLGFLPCKLPAYLPDVSKETLVTKIQMLESYEQASSKRNTSSTQLATAKTLVQDMSIVTVIKGFGGHKNIDKVLPSLRALLPSTFIISLGPIEAEARQYVNLATQVDDVTPFLQHSALLIMACGLNAIGEACQFDTPLLVIPDTRPHNEQEEMAAALIQAGRAINLQHLEVELTHAKPLSLILNSFRPVESLVAKLHTSHSMEFIDSIARASDVKSWFIQWLLPQLKLQPERL